MNTARLLTSVLVGAVACGTTDLTRDSSPLSFSILEGDYLESPPPPQIVLMLTTETEYPCSNYRLVSELSVTGNVIQVSVSHRVTKPTVCDDAIGPAGFRAALPNAVGTYTLELARDGVTDRYSVAITQTEIAITTLEAQFTHPTALAFPRAN